MASIRQYVLLILTAGVVIILTVALVAYFSSAEASTTAVAIAALTSIAVAAMVARAILRTADSTSQDLVAFLVEPVEIEKALAAQLLSQGMAPDAEAQARIAVIRYLTERPARADEKPRQ